MRTFRIGRILGIPVQIHASLILLIVAGVVFDVYSTAARGDRRIEHFWMTSASIIGFLVSLFLHELGHAWAARRLGFAVQSITFHAFGGFAAVNAPWLLPPHELRVAAAGPMVNLGLSVAAAVVWSVFPESDIARNVCLFNVLMGTLNLIPAHFPGLPLDGARILRAALAYRMHTKRAACHSARVGRYVAWAVLIAALLVRSWVLGIFAAFLLVGAWLARVLAMARYRRTQLIGPDEEDEAWFAWHSTGRLNTPASSLGAGVSDGLSGIGGDAWTEDDAERERRRVIDVRGKDIED
jgi:Zn-dependent protease